VDAHNIPDVIDAIGLIQHSPFWTKQNQLGMDLWFSRYLDWLLNSHFGRKEAQAIGNHGTWYDVQASSIALFLNKTDIAKNILESSMHKLLPQEIQPDGRQPFELKRTNSWDYSTFNLQGLFELASIG
jgi:alginate lyase